jgi:hypothetical protein
MFRNISAFMDVIVEHSLSLIYNIPETVEKNIQN